jgi:hypothetical protein
MENTNLIPAQKLCFWSLSLRDFLKRNNIVIGEKEFISRCQAAGEACEDALLSEEATTPLEAGLLGLKVLYASLDVLEHEKKEVKEFLCVLVDTEFRAVGEDNTPLFVEKFMQQKTWVEVFKMIKERAWKPSINEMLHDKYMTIKVVIKKHIEEHGIQ